MEWLFFTLLTIMIFLPWVIQYFFVYGKKLKFFNRKKTAYEQKITIIQNINAALDNLIKYNKGATIIIDDLNESGNYIADSEFLDAEVSSNLIVSIFESINSPLHDGAIIISNGKIKFASAYISKLSNKPVPKIFGTRHRSALGLSEITKAVIIVLSEETKNIHIFYKGNFIKVNKKDFFEKIHEFWN